MFFTTLHLVRLPIISPPSLIGLAAAHLDTHGGVELQRASAGSGLGVAVHYADLLAYLVDEYCNGVGVADYSGELSHRLGHQSRLHAYMSVAHVAVYLCLGGHSRNRVEDDDVDSAGAHQSFNYLQSLLAGVRLGNTAGCRYQRRAFLRKPGQAHAQRR